jgi:hypothetical protein
MSRIGDCNCCNAKHVPIGVDGECAGCEAEIAQQEAMNDLDPDIGQHDVGHEDDFYSDEDSGIDFDAELAYLRGQGPRPTSKNDPDSLCKKCQVPEHDVCSLNPCCPCCCDTIANKDK